MLRTGRDRMLDDGLVLPTVACDAEHLPFVSQSFDLVSVAFGLRNMTHKDLALSEMARVLRPGGVPAEALAEVLGYLPPQGAPDAGGGGLDSGPRKALA